jgi:hypothetical protein
MSFQGKAELFRNKVSPLNHIWKDRIMAIISKKMRYKQVNNIIKNV